MEQPLNDKKKFNGTQLSAVMNHIKLTDKKNVSQWFDEASPLLTTIFNNYCVGMWKRNKNISNTKLEKKNYDDKTDPELLEATNRTIQK